MREVEGERKGEKERRRGVKGAYPDEMIEPILYCLRVVERRGDAVRGCSRLE